MSGAVRPPAARPRHALSPASLLRRFGPLLGLLILCGALGAASDRFLTADNLLNVCRQSAVNALVSLGQLTVIITGGIDLSVGSVLGLCCVMVALLMHAGVPPLISVVAALAIGSALGAINGILLTKLHLPHPFIPTLGMMNVARGLALVISGGFPLSELPSGFRFWGAGSIGWIPAPVILVLLFCGAFYVFLSRTTIGRDIYAIGGNQQAARLSGVPVDARLVLAYALSGLTAAAGAIVKRAAADRLDRLMQWSVAIGFALVFTAQYFSNLPYSVYPKSDFWRDSPALILIRVGIMLLMMAGAYLWTEFGMGTTWSWMLCFGKTSLMVYWVHVMLVYGDLAKPFKRALSIPQTVLATLLVMLAMVALAAARLWWQARRAAKATAASAN